MVPAKKAKSVATVSHGRGVGGGDTAATSNAEGAAIRRPQAALSAVVRDQTQPFDGWDFLSFLLAGEDR